MSQNWKKKKNLDVHSSMLRSMLHLCSCIFSLLRHLLKYLPIINEKQTMMNELQLLIEMWIMKDELHPTNFSLSLSLSLFILFFSFPLIDSCYIQCILTLLDIGWTHLWIKGLWLLKSIEVLWAVGFVPCEAIELKFSKLASYTSLEQGGGWACYLLLVEVWVVKVKIDPIQMTTI